MDNILSNLRTIYKTFDESLTVADSVKSLFEAAPTNSLNKAIRDVAKMLHDTEYALIGGLAIGYHTKPRGTDDVDILLLDEPQVETVQSILTRSELFKQSRKHATIHKETGVEIELLSASYLKQPETLVKDTLQNTLKIPFHSYTLNVAAAKHIVALKLERFNAQDKADIQAFIKKGVTDINNIISDDKLLQKFNLMKQEVALEAPLNPD